MLLIKKRGHIAEDFDQLQKGGTFYRGEPDPLINANIVELDWEMILCGHALCLALEEQLKKKRIEEDKRKKAMTNDYLARIKMKQNSVWIQRTRKRVLELSAELQEMILADLVSASFPKRFGFMSGAELPAMATAVLKALLNAEPYRQSAGRTLHGGNRELWNCATQLQLVKQMPALARTVSSPGHPSIFIGLDANLTTHLQHLHLTTVDRGAGDVTPFTDANLAMQDLSKQFPALHTLKVDVINRAVMFQGQAVRINKTHANDAAYEQLVVIMRTLNMQDRYICFDTNYNGYSIQHSVRANGRTIGIVDADTSEAAVVRRLHGAPRCELLLLRQSENGHVER